MLYHAVDRVFRYFYVSNNHFLFDKAVTISSHTDINDFFNRIASLDLAESYYLRRPASGWVLAGLPNVQIRIMRMRDIPIGSSLILPSYIKRSRSIIGLSHHRYTRHAYTDNLCLFRCLALHYGASDGSLETPTKIYKKRLEQATGLCYDEGIRLDMLDDVETVFKIAINVYSLQQNKSDKVVRISTK